MISRTFKDWLIILLLIGTGLLYLILQIVSNFSHGSNPIQSSGDEIVISRSEILYESRTWLTIIFCFTGGITYLMFRKSGWIIAAGMLTLFVVIAIGGIIKIFTMGLIDVSTYLFGLIVILLLYSFIMLFTPATRKKFGLNRNDYMVAGVFTLFLMLFYFLVQ